MSFFEPIPLERQHQQKSHFDGNRRGRRHIYIYTYTHLSLSIPLLSLSRFAPALWPSIVFISFSLLCSPAFARSLVSLALFMVLSVVRTSLIRLVLFSGYSLPQPPHPCTPPCQRIFSTFALMHVVSSFATETRSVRTQGSWRLMGAGMVMRTVLMLWGGGGLAAT